MEMYDCDACNDIHPAYPDPKPGDTPMGDQAQFARRLREVGEEVADRLGELAQ